MIYSFPVALFMSCFLTISVMAGPFDGLVQENRPEDTSSPRKALSQFLELTQKGDYERAAYLLDMSRIPLNKQKEEGVNLSRKLLFILEQRLWIEPENLSDSLEGNLDDGLKNQDRIGYIYQDSKRYSILLSRYSINNDIIWVFSSQTVSKINYLYEQNFPDHLVKFFPDSFKEIQFLGLWLWQWILLPAAFLGAVGSGLIFAKFTGKLFLFASKKTKNIWDDRLYELINYPYKVLVLLLFIFPFIKSIYPGKPALQSIHSILYTAISITLILILFKLLDFLSEILLSFDSETNAQDIKYKTVNTQVTILKRILKIFIVAMGTGFILFQFEMVQKIGLSLIASAGIFSVFMGYTAQRSLGSILAGVQLLIAKPIRIGDEILFKEEYGEIEEINLTFIVVKLWNLKRAVIPIKNFLEEDFETWSRSDKKVIGAVYIYTDFTVPIEKIRKEFENYLKTNPNWDRDRAEMKMTESLENSIKLRFAVSAIDAKTLFYLRAELREHMTVYLTKLDSGRYLPYKRYKNN